MLLGSGAIRPLLFRWAARRGRRLVLVYHRVGRPPDGGIVSAVDRGTFSRQIQILSQVGSVVALESALQLDNQAQERVHFAITFDDDYQSHLENAVPILAEQGVPATFFLNGRIGGDPGPYWWQVLGQAIAQRGFEAVRAQLGSSAATAATLAAEIEAAGGGAQKIVECFADEREGCEPLLSIEQMQELAGMNVDIGFHGRDHRLMVGLAAEENGECLEVGRRELSQALGRPLQTFAYPHGKADSSARQAVKDSDYRYAFTGAGRCFSRSTPHEAVPRWDPSAVAADDFEVELALRFLLPTR